MSQLEQIVAALVGDLGEAQVHGVLGLCGKAGQHESWAESDDCCKECWENSHLGRESITVARGNRSA